MRIGIVDATSQVHVKFRHVTLDLDVVSGLRLPFESQPKPADLSDEMTEGETSYSTTSTAIDIEGKGICILGPPPQAVQGDEFTCPGLVYVNLNINVYKFSSFS